MTKRLTAGDRLRRDLEARLREAAEAAGAPPGAVLRWTPAEVAAVDRAVAAEDRRELLQAVFTRLHRARDADPAALAKLSAELRQLEKAACDAVGNLAFGGGPAKSARHQRAANRRWQRDAGHLQVVTEHG